MTTKAHIRYRNKDNKIVPGVTTILGLINKPALIPWAWNLGMHGEDYRKVTDKAADIGTIAHLLVECFLKNEKPDLAEYSTANIKQAEFAFSEFTAWWKKEGLKAIAVEYSMTSEIMQCGGMLDCVAMAPSGELWLVDIKTSKGIYEEMWYQLSAYWAMWVELNPDKPLVMAYICHLSKQTGHLTVHPGKDLFTELEIFRHMRAVYSLMKVKDPKRQLDRLYGKFNLERL